jgi:hypothetical protein
MATRPAGVRIRCDASIRPSQTATAVWRRLRSHNSALELQRVCQARGALCRTRRRCSAYEYQFPGWRHFELQLHCARRRRHSGIYKASPVFRYRLPVVAHLERQLRSEKSGVQRDSVECRVSLVQIADYVAHGRSGEQCARLIDRRSFRWERGIQPTCTPSIEIEPPATPSTGNVTCSNAVRVASLWKWMGS